jgi:hypothetical protein
MAVNHRAQPHGQEPTDFDLTIPEANKNGARIDHPLQNDGKPRPAKKIKKKDR